MIPLLWKEWREHRWKLAAFSLLLIAPLLAARLFHIGYDAQLELALPLLSCLAALWLAAFDITAERARRTALALDALPLPRIYSFLVRSAAGLLTILLPSALAHLLLRYFFHTVSDAYLPAVLMADAYIYLLLFAIATPGNREGFVALVGLLLFMGQAALSVLLFTALRGDASTAAMYLVSPIMGLQERVPTLLLGLIPWQLMVASGLWAIAALRYIALPRSSFVEPSAPQPAPLPQTPLFSPAIFPSTFPFFHPLVWKEWREQYPLVIVTAFVAISISFAITLGEIATHSANDALVAGRTFFDLLALIAAVAPTVVAIMLGISASVEDLDEPLIAFWRTRPFTAVSLFRIKYLTALLGVFTLLLFLGGFGMLGHLVGGSFPHASYTDEPYHPSALRVLVGELFWLPFVLMLAMASTVLLRRAIPASIITVAITLGLVYLPITRNLEFINILITWPIGSAFYISAASLFLLTLLLAALVHRSFTRESPQKSPPHLRHRPTTAGALA